MKNGVRAHHCDPQDLTTHYGARAKGELRRQTGLALLADGHADEGILQTFLAENERAAVGAIHPWFMGGEYLPDYLANAVEIARVTMKSTTMDVISIRARRTKHRLKYRIVDEHDNFWGGHHYGVRPATSVRPLTLRQLIDSINRSDLVEGPRNWNYEYGGTTPEEIFDFCTVSSEYYPQIEEWFDQVNSDWLIRERKRLEREESEAERQAIARRREEESRLAPYKGWADGATFDPFRDPWSDHMDQKIRHKILEYTADFATKHEGLPTGMHTLSVVLALHPRGGHRFDVTFPDFADDQCRV